MVEGDGENASSSWRCVVGFMVNHDNREFHNHVKGFMASLQKLLQLSRKMTVNTPEVGQIALGMMIIDHELDAYLRIGGESAEGIYTDYYAAKALAYGMAGRAREGRKYLDKARKRRQGGIYDEWCQDYYPNK